jgi:hypothetical protein
MLNAMAAPLKDLEEQIRLWITKKNLALAGDVTSQFVLRAEPYRVPSCRPSDRQ